MAMNPIFGAVLDLMSDDRFKSTDPINPVEQEDSLVGETPLGQDLDMPFRPGTEEALRPEYYETARKMHRAAHGLKGYGYQYVEEDTSGFPSTSFSESFSEPVRPVMNNVMDEPMNTSRGKTLGSTTDISGLGGRFNNNPRPFSNNTRKDYFWGVMGDEYLAQMRNEFDDIW